MYRYKNFTKDEMFVIGLYISSALVWCIFVQMLKIVFLRKILVPVFMLVIGYLCFNRQVKFLHRVFGKKWDYYRADAAVTAVKGEVFNNPLGNSSDYDVTVIEYRDNGGKLYKEEIHSYFALHKLTAGDTVKILVSRSDPHDIIIRFSDPALCVLCSVPGVIFEMISVLFI